MSLNRPARASRAESQSHNSDSRNERQRAISSKDLFETPSKSPGQRATEFEVIDFDRRLRDPQAHGPWTVAKRSSKDLFQGREINNRSGSIAQWPFTIDFELDAQCR